MTNEEQAAIACDMLLTGVVKLEMIGEDYRIEANADRQAQQKRAISIIGGWVEEYEHDPNMNRADHCRQDVFKRVLAFLKGE